MIIDWLEDDPRAGQPIPPEDPNTFSSRKAQAYAVIARHKRERDYAEVRGELRALLAANDMMDSPLEQELAAIVCRHRARRSRPETALASRERKQAVTCAKALLRHMELPPRRAGTTDEKRQTLLKLLDDLNAVVKLAPRSNLSMSPVLDRLRAGHYSANDLSSLLIALESLPSGTGAAPPPAKYLALLRAGVLTWKSCGRRFGYTWNSIEDKLVGPLPDFLRQLIVLARISMPSEDTLHKHIRGLKNL